MSVRSEYLATSEGALVSVSIIVQPKALESLLDSLAALDFPVNPGIYHDAALVTRFSDGREESKPITLVEFPAYAERIAEVRRALAGCGLEPGCMQVTAMLDELQSATHPEAVPPGAPYISRHRVRPDAVR